MDDGGEPIEDLVRACGHGATRLAIPELVRRLEPPLLRLASAILSDPVAAEDAFVEGMARAVPRIGGCESPERWLRYARASVRNAAVDLLRSRNERRARRALRDTQRLEWEDSRPGDPPFVERIPGPQADPEESLRSAQIRRIVEDSVEALDEPARSIVRLTAAGLDLDAVAEKLEMSRSSVQRRLGAARATLAARLRHAEEWNRGR
jgi:RNA polymerase sigma factor (sigma-70 family)